MNSSDFNRTTLYFISMTGLFFMGQACSAAENAAISGQSVYSTPLEEGNAFACATCHSLSEPASDEFRRVGHPIGNAFLRSRFKNGQLTNLHDAVNSCVTEWMASPTELSETDERWIALSEFLQESSINQTAETVTYSVVDPVTDFSSGDVNSGKALFNKTCASCHGQDAVGSSQAPALTGIRELENDYIAGRIRKSGLTTSSVYPGLEGGRMPFWSRERLSDEELIDITAYVRMRSVETANSGDGDSSIRKLGPTRSCGSDSDQVGKTTMLSTIAHDVSGTATVIDDCHIRIEEFNFDGGGALFVGVYGFTERGNLDTYNIAITPKKNVDDNLRSDTPYENATLEVTLPESISIDDFIGISIWCIDFAANFGDGVFE